MRIRSIASVSVAAVAMGMALATTPAQAAATVSYGPYQFKNDYSHLCMDVANGSKADGARIQQWDCYGGTPEKWRLDVVSTINGVNYYAFVNMNSGKCLDVPNGSTTPGVELQQWTCWSGDMQQWALYTAGTNSLTIRNLKSGLCVDVKNWGGAGAALQQWNCNNLTVQTWQYS
ncbi:RICIN domain-containing protein [Streptomyces sp. NPDC059743]|uniref:RICIN domain-containing protein n=1 Tax=Streptomyces sp. NPDC059743 TaxID=3346928 RepID=UPI003665A40C